MEELLLELERLTKLEVDLKKSYENLKVIYVDGFRHSYYEISEKLEGIDDPELRDSLCKRLDTILQMSDESDDSFSNRLFKLIDHVNLETIRLNRMRHINQLADKAQKDIQNTESIQSNIDKKVDILQNDVSGFHGQSIVILGIFTGIVIGFTAGLELISNAVNSLMNSGLNNTLIFTIVLGIVMLNLLFTFMYLISRIAGKSLAISCAYKDCTECPKTCRIMKKSWKKYPYLLAINGILFLLLLLIATAPFVGDVLGRLVNLIP